MVQPWQQVEISEILYRLGVDESHRGFSMAADAVAMCIERPELLTAVTKELYPAIARRHGTNWRAVERNIRLVVGLAWRQQPDLLSQLADAPLPRRPTATEFLCVLARHLRVQPPSRRRRLSTIKAHAGPLRRRAGNYKAIEKEILKMSEKFDYKEFVYNDAEIRDLMQDTPYSEGEPLPLFLLEVKAAAEAAKKDGFSYLDKPCERVFAFVRAVYFLGVQRGGEAYRRLIISNYADETDADPEPIPFELSKSCTRAFAAEIADADPADLNRFYKFMGF